MLRRFLAYGIWAEVPIVNGELMRAQRHRAVKTTAAKIKKMKTGECLH